MAGSAVTVVGSREVSVPARHQPQPELQQQMSSLRAQLGYGRRLRPGRSQLGLIILVVVAFWVLIGFGRTLTQLNTATNREAVLSAESAQLSARLEAGRRELTLVQTDAFQGLQARAYGLGSASERAFSLEPNAPTAPKLIPLGGVSSATLSQTPLDAWLRVLLGD